MSKNDEFFNTVRQVQVFGKVVDETGSIPLHILDEIEKRDNPQNSSCNNSCKAKSNKIKSNPENQTLDELAREIAERGNDMQTTHSKDGLKVFEVSKKLVKVIRS